MLPVFPPRNCADLVPGRLLDKPTHAEAGLCDRSPGAQSASCRRAPGAWPASGTACSQHGSRWSPHLGRGTGGLGRVLLRGGWRLAFCRPGLGRPEALSSEGRRVPARLANALASRIFMSFIYCPDIKYLSLSSDSLSVKGLCLRGTICLSCRHVCACGVCTCDVCTRDVRACDVCAHGPPAVRCVRWPSEPHAGPLCGWWGLSGQGWTWGFLAVLLFPMQPAGPGCPGHPSSPDWPRALQGQLSLTQPLSCPGTCAQVPFGLQP